MNTRRYPRTCDEAFGAYQRSSQCEFVPMEDPVRDFTAFDWCLYVLFVVALVVVGMTS
jgi:hypothetical protein